MNTHNLSVVTGGKSVAVSESLHKAVLALIVAKNSFDIAFLAEDCADMEVDQAEAFFLNTRASQEPNDFARDSFTSHRSKQEAAKKNRTATEAILNAEAKRFEATVLDLAGIPKCWHHPSPLVNLDEDNASVSIAYGNIRRYADDPTPADYDGYCILYITGEISWRRKPKVSPPQKLFSW